MHFYIAASAISLQSGCAYITVVKNCNPDVTTAWIFYERFDVSVNTRCG